MSLIADFPDYVKHLGFNTTFEASYYIIALMLPEDLLWASK